LPLIRALLASVAQGGLSCWLIDYLQLIAIRDIDNLAVAEEFDKERVARAGFDPSDLHAAWVIAADHDAASDGERSGPLGDHERAFASAFGLTR
jgi:hypothetical protein